MALDRPSPPSAPALLAGLLVAASAHPQAVLHPNQVVGTVGFTSSNPDVVEILEQPGPWLWDVRTRSGDPHDLEHRSWKSGEVRRFQAHETTVETAPTGIPYDLEVLIRTPSLADGYRFRPVPTGPAFPEPAGDLVVDVLECAGILRVRWFGEAGEPLGVTGGLLRASDENGIQAAMEVEPGSTFADLVVRGDGTAYDLSVRWTVGEDPYSDIVTYQRSFVRRVECDEILDVECSGPRRDGEPIELGRIVGRVDVLGEDEVPHESGQPSTSRTVVSAVKGPWGNFRHDRLLGSPASGAIELENLMPSIVEAPPVPYEVRARVLLRSGDRFELLDLPRIDVLVENGETVDIGETFVIDPGHVRGDILLAGPPAAGWWHGSCVEDLELAMDERHDADGDGIPAPPSNAAGSHVMAYGTSERAPGATRATTYAQAQAAFGGAFSGSEFVGDYELVLGGLEREASVWRAGALKLRFFDESDELMAHQESTFVVRRPAHHETEIVPGRSTDIPLHYCLGQVNVSFHATDVTFFEPRLSSLGSQMVFDGEDFEGTDLRYDAYGTASGLPADREDADDFGMVTACLPQGSYSLRPTVRAVNPGGGSSITELLPVDIEVGCRQVVNVFPELVLVVSPPPPCAEAGVLRLEGHVTSIDPVVRIATSVNGGPEDVHCTDCGVDPTFVVDVPLGEGDNEITVRAVDATGREATSTGSSLHAREPSALDRRADAPPLLVTREGRELHLVWEPVSGQPSSVYRGTLRSLWEDRAYDHRGAGACGLESGTASLDAAEGSAYFVVASACAWGDGSLGRNSSAGERPPALERCP